MRGTTQEPEIKLWRVPSVPDLTLKRIEGMRRARSSYSEDYAIVVLQEGAYESWYRGELRTHGAGELRLKEHGVRGGPSRRPVRREPAQPSLSAHRRHDPRSLRPRDDRFFAPTSPNARASRRGKLRLMSNMADERSDFGHGAATLRLGDLAVGRLGFGAMQLPGPGVWGEPKNAERARAVLRRVVELGITLIDTSWYYGPRVANTLIAEVLHPYPKNLVIACKLGGKRTPDKGWAPFIRPDELRQGCEEDLRTLKLERIDVVHLRWMNAGVPFLEALDALIDLQKEGKIRHLALSNVNAEQVEQALGRTPIVSVQNAFNIARGQGALEKMAHAQVENPEAVVDLCAAKGIAFMPFFPLVGSSLDKPGTLETIAKKHRATPAQIAIAWLLARSPTMLPIPGTSSVEHLEENWAARRIALDAAEIAAISG